MCCVCDYSRITRVFIKTSTLTNSSSNQSLKLHGIPLNLFSFLTLHYFPQAMLQCISSYNLFLIKWSSDFSFPSVNNKMVLVLLTYCYPMEIGRAHV